MWTTRVAHFRRRTLTGSWIISIPLSLPSSLLVSVKLMVLCRFWMSNYNVAQMVPLVHHSTRSQHTSSTGPYSTGSHQSHHPASHKVSVIRTLFSRANRLCSSEESSSTERAHINSALQKNGYPQAFVSRNCAPSRGPRTASSPSPTSPASISVVLPYVEGVAESIKRVLTPLGITVRRRHPLTLRHMLVKPKDPIGSWMKPGVIYRIPCASCSSSYIGETGRTLLCRVKEHKAAVRNRDTDSSALAEHWMETGHSFAWEDARVVEPCRAWYQRRSLEAWHIRSHPSMINRDRGALPPEYNCLIPRDRGGNSRGSRA